MNIDDDASTTNLFNGFIVKDIGIHRNQVNGIFGFECGSCVHFEKHKRVEKVIKEMELSFIYLRVLGANSSSMDDSL